MARKYATGKPKTRHAKTAITLVMKLESMLFQYVESLNRST